MIEFDPSYLTLSIEVFALPSSPPHSFLAQPAADRPPL